MAPYQFLFGFSRSSGIPSVVPETPEQREKFGQEALANDPRAKKRRMRVREKHRKRTNRENQLLPRSIGKPLPHGKDEPQCVEQAMSQASVSVGLSVPTHAQPIESKPDITSVMEKKTKI